MSEDFFNPYYNKIKSACLVTLILSLKGYMPKCLIIHLAKNFTRFPKFDYRRIYHSSNINSKENLYLNFDSKKTYLNKNEAGASPLIYCGLFFVIKDIYYVKLLDLMMGENLIEDTGFICVPTFYRKSEQKFIIKMIEILFNF